MDKEKMYEKIKNYNIFIYDKFEIKYNLDEIEILYYYEIVGLKKFIHKLVIPYSKINLDKEFVEKLVFNIGLIELVSYWKATIAPKLVINCGNITNKQKDYFRKVYYYGQGEFFYKNNLNPCYDDFIEFDCKGKRYDKDIDYYGTGNIIAVGGGKDSCVTLSLYEKNNSNCFIINPKDVQLECAHIAGYDDSKIYKIRRILDKGIIDLNNEGFLNGHIPFSAMIAFVSFLTAYLNNKKSIILSNENSANEANVLGTKINHQYSKSYEFESDFQEYAKKFLNKDIKYYSFLRPLNEYQIGMIFSKNKAYHKIFKSCNLGSKNDKWQWCCNCAKCLYIYSLLSPFLYKKDLEEIFGEDMFENQELLSIFTELLGKSKNKPFECVGTYEEINYAITKTVQKLEKKDLPYLLNYYYHHYYDESILSKDLEHFYSEDNSLPLLDSKRLKEVINYDK